jgi:tRNA-specific 2-thiouridylase
MKDFADAYLRGETPIPCIRCNQTIKFRDLLDVARDLGAEAMATGHYVRREAGPKEPELHRAADPARNPAVLALNLPAALTVAGAAML